MSLRPAEWKCFVVVSRSIQRGENGGLISEREVARRTGLALRHVTAALDSLVNERALLGRKCKSGSTTEYYLPFHFRGNDRIPTGIQSGPVSCIPRGKQSRANCIPTGEQNCIPTGEHHLNYLESSENTHQNSGATDSVASPPEETREPVHRPITPLPRLRFEEFPCGGWNTSEDFETWWARIVAGHPNKHQNAVAKKKALALVLSGQLNRVDSNAATRHWPPQMRQIGPRRTAVTPRICGRSSKTAFGDSFLLYLQPRSIRAPKTICEGWKTNEKSNRPDF